MEQLAWIAIVFGRKTAQRIFWSQVVGSILLLLVLIAVFAPRPDYREPQPRSASRNVVAPKPVMPAHPVSAVTRDGCWLESDGLTRCLNQLDCPQDQHGFPDCRAMRPVPH